MTSKVLPPLREDPTSDNIYVIGDVEGKSKLLAQLLVQIEQAPLASNDKIVITGNYLKGDAKENLSLLQILKNYQAERANQLVLLKGESEFKIAKGLGSFFKSHKEAISFRKLFESNIKKGNYDKVVFNVEALSATRKLFGNLEPFYENDKVFVTSGGVNPKMELGRQFIQALPFLKTAVTGLVEKPMVKLIVHGAISRTVETEGFLSVYTNPSVTNRLSCAVIDARTGKLKEMLSVSQ